MSDADEARWVAVRTDLGLDERQQKGVEFMASALVRGIWAAIQDGSWEATDAPPRVRYLEHQEDGIATTMLIADPPLPSPAKLLKQLEGATREQGALW